MGTIPASENVFPVVRMLEGAAAATPPTGEAHLYVKSDGLLYWKDDAGTEYAVNTDTTGGLAAHLADTADAHDASAVSIVDAGTLYTATDVEAALAEVMTAVGAGGIPVTTIDAKGDLVAGTANDTADNLTVGANGSALIAASGETTGLKWGIPTGHGCVVYHNTTQTVNNSFLLFNSEVSDPDGYHDTSSQTDRITIPAGLGGLYVIAWASGGVVSLAAAEFFRVNLNNASNISANTGGTAAVNNGYLHGSFIYRLAAGDYIRLNFTGNRSMGHASAFEAQSMFSVALVGA
jgi:hypothetical protein